MKKLNLLLTILIGLMSLSCSTDSDNNTNFTNEVYKYESSLFYGDILTFREVVFYENEKRKIDSVYGSVGDLRGYTKWFYNSKGLLNSIEHFDTSNSKYLEVTLNYDNQNKLIETNTNYISSSTINTTYEYPTTDSVISTTYENGSFYSENTFSLNNLGFVIKEVSQYGNVYVTVEYSGINPVKKTFYDGTLTVFNYDINRIPSNFFLNTIDNLFGNNNANPILFNNTLNFNSPIKVSNYITSIEREGFDKDSAYSYDFDNNDRLINTTIITGNERIEEKYFYK